ncbi:MAG: hypothetical protein NVSMB25_21620 [Thermoleophilaceae bacterium]
MEMKKELRPVHDEVSCAVCGRTILKGERTEAYLAPGGERHDVCELCSERASDAGWIRESAHDDLPAASRRAEPRRPLLARLRRRRDSEPFPFPDDAPTELPDRDAVEAYEFDPRAEEPERPPPPPPPAPARRKDPRHVRAVPTNAQAKIERAFELFNSSDHVRTIAGIGRTLGEPWVSAGPTSGAPSEVTLIVAWELSWYRYRVDLAEAHEPVTLVAKGQELDELEESMRDWNATALPDGRLAIGVPS